LLLRALIDAPTSVEGVAGDRRTIIADQRVSGHAQVVEVTGLIAVGASQFEPPVPLAVFKTQEPKDVILPPHGEEVSDEMHTFVLIERGERSTHGSAFRTEPSGAREGKVQVGCIGAPDLAGGCRCQGSE
jgi:hypothetical protein